MTQAMKPELVLDAQALLGEGPRWHAGERRLYWVDILKNELHRFDPESGADAVRLFEQPIGCFAFRAKGGFLLAMKDGLATIDDWDAPVVPFGPQVLTGHAGLRFNDGRTDPSGRFWVGSVDMTRVNHDAAFYRVEADASLTEVVSGMLTGNGSAFSADGRRFYRADTPTHQLTLHDVDPVAGTLSEGRTIHSWPHGLGRPDGGSVDEAGCYWTALYTGGRVVRLSADGDLMAEVPLPVSGPTMIAFGGEDRRTAYVTTARAGFSEEVLAREPYAGGLFSFRVDVPGLPEWPFAG